MTTIAVQGACPAYRSASSARLIERTTTASVALLAGIAALVSYGHMHALAMQHGEGRMASALIPLSVDGMIVASSMSLLLDSRLGRRGGLLPWTLLITGAAASQAANIAVAEPALLGRVIAAWPSFALTASYELLMRQVRRAARSRRQAAAAVGAEPAKQGAATPGSPRRCRTSWAPGQRHRMRALAAGGGCCSGRRGNGRRPTGARTGHCPPGCRSPGSSIAATGGDGWSPAWAGQASSPPGRDDDSTLTPAPART